MNPKQMIKISRVIGGVLHGLPIEVAMAVLSYSMVCVLRQVTRREREYLVVQLVEEVIEELKKIENEEEIEANPGRSNDASPWGWK